MRLAYVYTDYGLLLILFLALLELPPAEFKMFMDSIIWAIKHTMRDIADTGLNCA